MQKRKIEIYGGNYFDITNGEEKMYNSDKGDILKEELNQFIYESARKDMDRKTAEGLKKAAAKFSLIPEWRDAAFAESECRKCLNSIQTKGKTVERKKQIIYISWMFLCILLVSGIFLYLGSNSEKLAVVSSSAIESGPKIRKDEGEIIAEYISVIITQSGKRNIPDSNDPFNLSEDPRIYYCECITNEGKTGLIKLTAKQFEECITECISISHSSYQCKKDICFVGKTEKMPDSMYFSLDSEEFYGIMLSDLDPGNVVERMREIEDEKDSFYKDNYSGKDVLIVREFYTS